MPCTPNPVTDPQDDVTAGTYCVCNAGNHNEHGDYKEPHLALNQAVVIPDPKMVSDVQVGAYQVKMTLASNKRELNGLVNLPHLRTAGSGLGAATHLVRIEPVKVTAEEPVAGCTDNKNTLKISFCYRDKASGEWVCKPPDADFGDTHVQN